MNMVERKAVIEGLRVGYNGVFELDEFYKTVEEWISKQGREKQILKKLEHVTEYGSDIEWFIECWKMIGDYAKPVVRMRALFNDVVDVEINKDGYKKIYNKGNVLILLDGYIETLLEGRWTQKPTLIFTRTLFDRFIHKYWTERFDAQLKKDTFELYRILEAFFNLYLLKKARFKS